MDLESERETENSDMPVAKRKRYPKSVTDFVARVFAVIEAFRYKGKPYLSYLQSREGSDEFLMRDNLIKPLFAALGYHLQQDFSPEETIATGRVDTIIRNRQNHPVIAIETQSSTLKDLTEHRKRLFNYAGEIGARFAVLSDGVRLEVWHRPETWKSWTQLIKQINLEDNYRKFLASGVDGLGEAEVYQLLKLKYLSREFTFVSEEELYKEPELDVSDSAIFSQLMEDLQGAMQLVKEEIQSQFELRRQEYKEYQQLVARREGGEAVYPSQFKKLEDSRRAVEAFNGWRHVSGRANSGGEELFCTETMYILFNRVLLMRIFEDRGVAPRRVSNGGIKDWLNWRGFFEFRKAKWADLLRDAYKTMNELYPHLFRQDVFDWYMPESETVLHILFAFNRYNFKNVDRDVLGKLYESYLEKEERKRLGQFYTPEEVIDYILEAVGYTVGHEIEGKLLLDPACGSGGFLVRAVKVLNERLKAKGFDAETILRQIQEHIYGFDINPFAAHLAEMNLLFQVIDLISEAKQVNPSFSVDKFNIYVTDSLRPPGQTSLWEPLATNYAEDAEVVRQIKLKQGRFALGFDFVVGNPPYVRTETITQDYKKRLAQDFQDIYRGRFDLYIFFIGLGLKMLSENGKLGFITPAKFLVTENGGALRQYILKNTSICQLIDISQSRVFKDVGNYPVIVVFQREKDERARTDNKVRVGQLLTDSIEVLPDLGQAEELVRGKPFHVYQIQQERFSSNFDYIFDIGRTEELYALGQKIAAGCVPLSQICETHQGIITGRREPADTARRKNIVLAQDIPLLPPERERLCQKVIDGKNMPNRYTIEWRGERLIYAPNELTAPRETMWFESKKLIIQKIAKCLTATYDEEKFYCLDTLYVGLLKDINYDLKYILALLNSRLMDFYYRAAFETIHIGGDYLEYRTRYLDTLPIKPAPATTQEELVELVDEILTINKELPRLKALVGDFPSLVSSLQLSLVPLASSSSVVAVNMPPILGVPRLSIEGRRVYLSKQAFIDIADEKYARYLWLYLNGIKDELRGKNKGEILQLACLPSLASEVDRVLEQKVAVESKIRELEEHRSKVDAEIDGKVYQLYGLTEEEKQIVGGSFRS